MISFSLAYANQTQAFNQKIITSSLTLDVKRQSLMISELPIVCGITSSNKTEFTNIKLILLKYNIKTQIEKFYI